MVVVRRGAFEFGVARKVEIAAVALGAATVGHCAHDRGRAFGAGAQHDPVQDNLAVPVAQHAEIAGGRRLAGAQALVRWRMGHAERQELHLLHVHKLGARAQRDGIRIARVAAHGVGFREVQRTETAGRDNHRRRADGDERAVRRVVDQTADDSPLLAADDDIEEPCVFEIIDAAALDHRVPRSVADGKPAVPMADRTAAGVASERKRESLGPVPLFVHVRAHAVAPHPVVGVARVLGERRGDLRRRQIRAGDTQILRQLGFGIVVVAARADGNDALGDLGIGTADRVLRDDQHMGACFGRRVRGRAAGPAGADHDHVVVAPHGLDRHAPSPSVGGADHAANARRTQRRARSLPRPPAWIRDHRHAAVRKERRRREEARHAGGSTAPAEIRTLRERTMVRCKEAERSATLPSPMGRLGQRTTRHPG